MDVETNVRTYWDVCKELEALGFEKVRQDLFRKDFVYKRVWQDGKTGAWSSELYNQKEA